MSTPEVFASLNKCDPSAPILSKEEGNNAVKDLLKNNYIALKYPKVQRLRTDPPCPGNQVYSLHTFVPASGAKPDKDGIYGVMKIRGTFPNEEQANQWCEKIIREVDSYNEIFVGYVGKEFPLTTLDKFAKVDEINLREEMNNIAKEEVKKKREQEEQEKQSIENRRKALLEESRDVKEKSLDPLDFYTTMCIKRASLRSTQEDLEKKKKEIDHLLKEHSKTIHKLDDENPTFCKMFKERYMKSIKDIGGDEKSNPLVKYL